RQGDDRGRARRRRPHRHRLSRPGGARGPGGRRPGAALLLPRRRLRLVHLQAAGRRSGDAGEPRAGAGRAGRPLGAQLPVGAEDATGESALRQMSHPTLPLAFAAAAQRHAGRIALVGEDGQVLSYEQLDRLRIDAGRALIAMGVQPGERVAIWGQNCVEWIIAALGVLSVGAAVEPVNTRMKGSEVAYVLQRSGARLLFSAGRFLDQYYPAVLAPHRPPGLENIVVLRDAENGAFTWQAFLDRAAEVPAGEVAKRSAAVTADSLMDVIFTSGTTGLPKGVMTAHGQNLRTIAEWSRHMELVPEDRYLVVNPFFHTFGYKFGWMAGLLAGAMVLPHAVFDAAVLMSRVAHQRISVLPGPPTLFISILNDPRRRASDLSSLRATITGAAAIA